jgi:hypothetical protein
MRSFVWLGLIVAMSWSSVALAVEGTVRLKNGGFVEGDVFEELPGERVSVRTVDGAVRSIPWAEVDRVEHAAAPAPAPTPPPSAAQPTAVTPYDAGTGAPAPPPPEEEQPSTTPAAQSWSSYGDSVEERSDDVTLTLFGALGLLGNIAIDGEATLTMNGVTEEQAGSDDYDLDLAYGGGAQLDVPVHRFFSVSGQLRLTSWMPKDVEGSRPATFIDVLAAPRLRFPFPLGAGSFGVAYVQVPVGLGHVHFPGDADPTVSPALVVGFSAGFIALLSEHVGLAFEIGWLHHSFSVEIEQTLSTGTGDILIESESDWSVNQALLQAGLVIDF